MSLSTEFYDTDQPWVCWQFMKGDDEIPEEGGESPVRMTCCVCGARETIMIQVPSIHAPETHPHKHPARVAWLAKHVHSPLPHALTWALPLKNIAAHRETPDVLGAVARHAAEASQ